MLVAGGLAAMAPLACSDQPQDRARGNSGDPGKATAKHPSGPPTDDPPGTLTDDPTDDPPLTLWLAGDVHFGQQTDDLLAPIAAATAGAIGIVNLEGPVGMGESTGARLVNTADALPVLVAHGVAVASVRNNHMNDLGDQGVRHTRAALTRAGIQPADADHPGEPALAVIERAGLSLAVLAHDLSPVREQEALGDMRPLMQQALAAARARADLVAVSLHITGPPSYLPPKELIEAVDLAIAGGATVVAAHGSHAPARVERRGTAIIAWGLGNLLFNCTCTREIDGLVVRVELDARGTRRAQVIPVDAGLLGQPARPAEAAGLTLDLLRSLGSELTERAAAHAFF